tara:strand:- start:51 stop:338 length:288 start_codon:yes stop_codon:yes gene_type:complete
MNSQDNKASLPKFYRSLCERLKLSRALALMDEAGAHHDKMIKPLGYILAGLHFGLLVLWNFIGGVIILAIPSVVMVMVYAILPQRYKDKYFELID